jgi:hypothetical protein
VSRQLVNDYDLIVHEDLHISSMLRRPRPRPNEQGGFDNNGASAKAGLNRSIQDSGWGVILGMLAYKATLLCLSRGNLGAGCADRPGTNHSGDRGQALMRSRASWS